QQIYADYNQWEEASEKRAPKIETPSKSVTVQPKVVVPKKLSYKEQKELDGMELAILVNEKEIEELNKLIDDPQINITAQKSLELYQQLANSQKKLENLYERWQY